MYSFLCVYMNTWNMSLQYLSTNSKSRAETTADISLEHAYCISMESNSRWQKIWAAKVDGKFVTRWFWHIASFTRTCTTSTTTFFLMVFDCITKYRFLTISGHSSSLRQKIFWLLSKTCIFELKNSVRRCQISIRWSHGFGGKLGRLIKSEKNWFVFDLCCFWFQNTPKTWLRRNQSKTGKVTGILQGLHYWRNFWRNFHSGKQLNCLRSEKTFPVHVSLF